MVMLKGGEVDRFINQPGDKYSVILVYGPDTGLVSERCQKLAHILLKDASDPFSMTRLDADETGFDAVRLADELYTIGLFGSAKLVRLRMGGKSQIAGFATFLEQRAANTLLIEAGDLSAKSTLRTAVERSVLGVALPCYGDEQRDLPSLIDAVLKNSGQKISADAKASLAGMLGSDRLLSRQEIEKLALFALGKAQIEVADVEAIIADSSALLVDQIIDNLFLGEAGEADYALERALQENVAPDQLIGSALRHALSIRNARFQRDSGRSINDIERDARIFFKRQAAFRQQLARWTVEGLEGAIILLGEAQNLLRNSKMNTSTIVSRSFLSIALAARRARGSQN
jgi:DNA polymerase-3 subunit delta